jgi:predicted DNA-binding protein YlxM (UPF0122 family)
MKYEKPEELYPERPDLQARAIFRYHQKVDSSRGPEECWPSTARRLSRGYGQFTLGMETAGTRINTPAHRFGLYLATGVWPKSDVFAIHACDNPPCQNPRHLRWGSHLENMSDMTARGRHAVLRSEDGPGAKLTEEQVESMLRLYYIEGRTRGELARTFGVSEGYVWHIAHGNRWPHVHERFFATHDPDRDAVISGHRDRSPRGEAHYATTFTESQVEEILRLHYIDGVRVCDLARTLGRSYSMIRHVTQGNTWSHVYARFFDSLDDSSRLVVRTVPPGAKLDKDQVERILALYYSENVRINELAHIVGVSSSTIWDIVHGRTWPHVHSRFMEAHQLAA